MAGKLQLQWSPEQIAGWLKQTYPDDPSGQVSAETIYRSLFIQARGALKVPGHWEGDLLFGSKNSQIATLVERQTRYVMLVKVAGKDTETVINALIKNARKLPEELYKSLTWDRGKEMADHKRFTLATDIQVYFSVILRILGSAAAMRTRTDYCGSTSPRERTSQATRKQSSTPWPED